MRNYINLIPANQLRRIVTSHVFPTGYVGNMLCPRVLIGRNGGRILKANINTFSVKAEPYVAGTAPLFESWEGSSQDLTTDEYRIGTDIPVNDIAVAETQGIAPQTFMQQEIISRLEARKLDSERAILTYYGTYTNWGAGNRATPSTKWDDTGGTPLADINDQLVAKAIRPNFILMGQTVYEGIRASDEYLGKYKYTTTPGYTKDIENLKGEWGVRDIKVLGMDTGTDQYKPEPGADLATLLGDVLIMAYIDPSLRGDIRFASTIRTPVAFVNPVLNINPMMDEGPEYDAMLKIWWASFMDSYNPTTVNEDIAFILYDCLL